LGVLNNFKIKDALVVTPLNDEILEKSSRNLPRVKVLRADGLNVYDILKHDSLLLLETAVSPIEEALA
jgi:large subunit ribosomal protein L4